MAKITDSGNLSRRELLGAASALAAVSGLGLLGCSVAESRQPDERSLPPASPDPESEFGVDATINMETVDEWLHRPDVAYRDMRLLLDPARYEDVGGDADLAFTLEGFKVVPYPYIGTLQRLPVDGAYDGETLFDVEWGPSGEIAGVSQNYEQSLQIVEELFPRDKAVFLICGGAGYAMMMRKLLVYLGWNETRVYNVGGAWGYSGYHPVELVSLNPDGGKEYCFWRADVATIDFGSLV